MQLIQPKPWKQCWWWFECYGTWHCITR